MSEPPKELSLGELLEMFERIRSPQPDHQEANHRRAIERLMVRTAGLLVALLLVVSGWIALDPLGRYGQQQRQQGLGAFGVVVASLISLVAGYSAKH